MQFRLNTIVVLSALLMVTAYAVQAKPADIYYWNEMPGLALGKTLGLDRQTFPDLADGALQYVEYTEERNWDESNSGFVTIRPGIPIYLSALYFSSLGTTQIYYQGTPLNPENQVTLTLKLPQTDSQGIVYLVAWHAEPEADAVQRLARDPYGSGEPVQGLAATATLRRSPGETAHHPWDDEFRSTNWIPPVDASADLPLLVVRINDEGVITTKDCTVDYNGLISYGFDDWGSIGRFELTGTEGISIQFQIPFDLRYTECTLLVYGSELNSARSGRPAIEAIINNWSFANTSPGEGPGSAMQHFYFDVGHYLKGGYNLMEIRQPVQVGTPWAVERIELWID